MLIVLRVLVAARSMCLLWVSLGSSVSPSILGWWSWVVVCCQSEVLVVCCILLGLG